MKMELPWEEARVLLESAIESGKRNKDKMEWPEAVGQLEVLFHLLDIHHECVTKATIVLDNIDIDAIREAVNSDFIK